MRISRAYYQSRRLKIISRRLSQSAYFAWFCTFTWMLIIFMFSNQAHSGAYTQEVFHDYNILARKTAHILEYLFLYVLMERAFLLSNWTTNLRLKTLALCVLYCFSDEFHQSFVPGRSATIGDALFDSSGAILGLALMTLLRRAKSS
jgi:VanZ family protein